MRFFTPIANTHLDLTTRTRLLHNKLEIGDPECEGVSCSSVPVAVSVTFIL